MVIQLQHANSNHAPSDTSTFQSFAGTHLHDANVAVRAMYSANFPPDFAVGWTAHR
jgi:hypothetical protein